MKNLSRPIVQIFLIWRIWLFIPIIVGIFLLPFRPNSLFTTFWQYAQPKGIIESPLISSWSNFDGVHYFAIASRGYLLEGRFLPLFPLIIRVVATPTSLLSPIIPYDQRIFWLGLILANFFTLAGVWLLFKLLRLDINQQQASKTILLLLAFPTSFFFGAIYSEGLFLLLSVASLWLARQQKWWLAVTCGALLSITRLSGFLIILPLMVEYFYQTKHSSFSVKPLIKFLLIPLPLILYAIYCHQQWGDYLYFIHAHGFLGNSREVSSLIFPLVTVYRYLKIFLSVSVTQYEFWIALLEFISLLIAVVGIILSWKQKLRPSYQVYIWSILALPLLSGTLSGFPRYLLLAFPLFISFGQRLSTQTKLAKITIGFSLLLQGLLLMLFARGWYVS